MNLIITKMESIKHLWQLMRPDQYIKNIFIFAPIFFAGQITNINLLVTTLLAFIAFCLSASAIYIFNDYRDIQNDRLHPFKKDRPLAAGKVSKQNAIVLMLVLLFLGISMMASLSIYALTVLVGYILLNIAYSLHLKHIAILDVSIIAIGFVLRIFIGEQVTMLEVSPWLIIMTFLLALFLALAKRRNDIILFLDSPNASSPVIDGYNTKMIDFTMIIITSVVIMTYILYVTSSEIISRLQSEYLYLSAIFVILGIMRYLQITLVQNRSGSPTKIALSDKFIQSIILAWLSFFVWLLYII